MNPWIEGLRNAATRVGTRSPGGPVTTANENARQSPQDARRPSQGSDASIAAWVDRTGRAARDLLDALDSAKGAAPVMDDLRVSVAALLELLRRVR